jgi:hypothetical protein
MAEANDNYVCNCGCALEFEMYKPGLDVFVGERWLITSDSMVEYSWESYVPTGMHKNWMELKEYIIQKRNEALPRMGNNYRPYIHLYNVNLARYEGNADPIPLNSKLYYECAF